MKKTLPWILSILMSGSVVLGQYSTPALRPNALDASRQVGAGGYNAPNPSYNYGSSGLGNLYITGNVTAGKSFRGFVPYKDPTQFQSRLGSSALSGFESDAPNIQRVERGYSPGQVTPFYNRSSTLLPLSAQVQGLTVPGSSIPRIQTLPRSESYGIRALSPPLNTEGFTQLPPSVRPTDILIPNIMLPQQAQLPEGPMAPITPTPAPMERPVQEEPQPLEPWLERPQESPANQQQEEQPVDYSAWLAEQAERAGRPMGLQQQFAEQAERLGIEGHLMTTTQMAPSEKVTPTPPPAQDSIPELKTRRPSAVRSSQPVVSSLVGKGNDAFSQTMRLGQRLLTQGKFYEAFNAYSQALTIKPDDPMPQFGQANALIGAGDLRSGGAHLEAAIKKFPKFLRLQLDGSRLMGSQGILDRRREQVENLVKKNDRPQVLLLHGYLQLLSGNREAGLGAIAKSGLVTVE